MKEQLQMLHLPLLRDDPSDLVVDSCRMKEYHHRPSLDSISEINDDNNNNSDKLADHPVITITGCDDEHSNIGNDTWSPTRASPRNSLTGSDSDLNKLKVTAMKLKLGTRRASYVEWRERYIEKPRRRSKPDLRTDIDENGNGNEKLTEERKDRINEALDWLRTELHEMRSQDQVLARTLLTLRHDIHQLKLKRSCDAHKEMLEDVKCDLEDFHEMREISDSPTDAVENPFRHLGVTPMNISARRFSIF